MARDKFVFHKAYFDVMRGLSKEDAANMMMAIGAYVFYGAKPPKENDYWMFDGIYKLITSQIDREPVYNPEEPEEACSDCDNGNCCDCETDPFMEGVEEDDWNDWTEECFCCDGGRHDHSRKQKFITINVQ